MSIIQFNDYVFNNINDTQHAAYILKKFTNIQVT